MAPPRLDNDYLYTCPGHVGCQSYALSITAVDASVTLPAGFYSLHLEGSTTAWARLGSAAAFPTSGGGAVYGFPIVPGYECMLIVGPADGDLHVIGGAAGPVTLYATRVL